MRKLILIFTALFIASHFVYAQPVQDKTQLEKERANLLEEIKAIERDYNRAKKQTKVSLAELTAIKKKISLQERFLSNINKEIKMIDDDIYRSNIEIYRLQNQLDTLKMQYAKSVVYAYKNRSNYDYLNFIFSASSFNDAMKRISYLKQYRKYREQQVETIQETQELIAKRKQSQLIKKESKNVALQNQTVQVNELAKQQNEKASVVTRLKSQEKDLGKQLAARKKRDSDLRRAIAAAIRREIDAAKKEEARLAAIEKEKEKAANAAANKANTGNASVIKPSAANVKPATAPAKEKSYLNFNANEAALADQFEQNKGKLPWPVDNGFVSIHFGAYTVEGTNIKGDNPGITIATSSAGQSVKAVFDGEVMAVHNLGNVQAVIVKHGKYITSYSNLSSVSVGKGSNLTKGQVIGKTGTADDGSGGQLDFMLLIETREQNPESWLRRGG